MGAQLGRLPGHGCSCAMPAVCCVRGEDGGDLLQFETIKCKQATCDGPPDGAPMGLAVQVPVVVVGASTPTSKDQRHRPPALQLAACHAPLLVAQPSLVREATPMSPRTPRLRPPTPRQCIPLVTVTTSRSPSLQLQPQQQKLHEYSPKTHLTLMPPPLPPLHRHPRRFRPTQPASPSTAPILPRTSVSSFPPLSHTAPYQRLRSSSISHQPTCQSWQICQNPPLLQTFGGSREAMSKMHCVALKVYPQPFRCYVFFSLPAWPCPCLSPHASALACFSRCHLW
mmetsp:Transcript_58203/g.112297  ORF Transcript_58203/g.112297 Transcript_58203/m.112297 type:complete len:283 (+) Transcript_58203:55-903(+)